MLLSLYALLAPAAALADGTFSVGTAKRDITPANPVNLGGFGLGAVRVSQSVEKHIFVRLIAISNGAKTVIFEQDETQGMFAAHRNGGAGHTARRQAIASALAQSSGCPGVGADSIISSTDHTHAGPDTTGAWGGVAKEYYDFIRDQAVAAALDACGHMKSANLFVGKLSAPELNRNDFCPESLGDSFTTMIPCAPAAQQVDNDLRVLVAKDPASGAPVAAMLNWGSHPTSFGSNGGRMHGDWPAQVADNLEAVYGFVAPSFIGDIGRSHPKGGGGYAYSQKLTDLARQLIDGALVRVSGSEVESRVLFIREPANNAIILGLDLAGDRGCDAQGQNVFRIPDGAPAAGGAGSCVPLNRSSSPPYLTGNVVGTFASTVRIGDVLVAGAPGELYPSAREELVQLVNVREIFLIGLAQDQLGYLVHPTEAYASVAALAVPSDNFLFAVSSTIGDHWMCTALKGTLALGFTTRGYPAKCNLYTAEPNDFPGDGNP